MARTRQEVRNFLEGKVGTVVVDKSNSALNGQCVALVKALMEFLGVANPYAARGNAKDVGNNYIAQGIGTSGRGWLTICINRDFAAPYGHVWADLQNEANYESNGATALRTTKNTRPISQAQQFVNFDKWIADSTGGQKLVDANDLNHIYQYGPLRRARNGSEGGNVYEGKTAAFVIADHRDSTEGKKMAAHLANIATRSAQLDTRTTERDTARKERDAARTELTAEKEKAAGLAASVQDLTERLAEKPKEVVVEKEVEKIVEVPVETIKEVEVEKIVEVVKGDEERSFGDLLAAAFRKLFNLGGK